MTQKFNIKGVVTGSALPLRRQLALSTALASAMLGFYGSRAAYAGSCYGAAGTYLCSIGANAASDLAQTLSGAPLTVTTSAGFGIDTRTSGGNAFTLTATHGLTFADDHYSTITGGNSGISALNQGTGALSITSTGSVTGNYGHGVDALNRNAGTDLTIAAADASGWDRGIYARNQGTGALNITANGTVTGGRGSGIDARNSGTELTIAAAGASGRDNGIFAENRGTGALSVTATGSVTGTYFRGIAALNGTLYSPSGTDLTIAAADATGQSAGIFARNYGSGALSISASGTVTGTGVAYIPALRDAGVYARNDHGTDLAIAVADVSGEVSGIYARNRGSGALSVSASGTVTSRSGHGVRARNDNGTDLAIAVAAVSGASRGIDARNYGSGVLSISTSGAVTGTNAEGIWTVTGTGKQTNIMLNAGATVSGGNGTAISNDVGNSTVAVNAGAIVKNDVRLGDGSDDLIFDGGRFSAGAVLDGGDDTSGADGFVDTLTFRNLAASVTGGNLVGWEHVVIDSGAAVSLSGMLAVGQLNVLAGGTLGGTVTVDGDVFVDGGTLGRGNSPGTLTVLGDLIIDVGSVLRLKDGDMLDVGGLFEIREGARIDLLFAGLAPNMIDLSSYFSNMLPVFENGFANIGFNLFTSDVSAVGQAISLTFGGGQSITLVAAEAVPLPGSLALFGAGLFGLAGLGFAARRRKAA